MEALEFLVENKYSFQRTFYIGFGHDEEVTLFYFITNYLSVCHAIKFKNVNLKVSGFEGAGHIAKHLKSTGVSHLDFVLDEGYFVLEDMVEGVDDLVSVYEKIKEKNVSSNFKMQIKFQDWCHRKRFRYTRIEC